MGIVLKQSFVNTIILFLGFAIGGINVLFLYTNFLHEDYYGLVTFLLSSANIVLPLLVFGMLLPDLWIRNRSKANELDTVRYCLVTEGWSRLGLDGSITTH